MSNRRLDGAPEVERFLRALETHPAMIRTYREGSWFGMVVGALLLLGGFVMTVMGLSGTSEWIIESMSLRARLVNASPGAVFAIIGMVLMFRYKPKVKTDIEIKINESQAKDESGTNTKETTVRYQSSASSPLIDTSRRR